MSPMYSRPLPDIPNFDLAMSAARGSSRSEGNMPALEPQQATSADQTTLVATAMVGHAAPAASDVAVCLLEEWVPRFIQTCKVGNESKNTTATRASFYKCLMWFLHDKEFQVCGEHELLQFFYYLKTGHEDPRGRWANPRLRKPVRPVTVKDYHIAIRTLFKWLQAKGLISSSPMAEIPKPVVHDESKAPLSVQQVDRMFQAAAASTMPARNAAILAFLLDSGCRVSELVGIKLGDVDIDAGKVTVIGKGDKYRTLHFLPPTATVLRGYLTATARSFENDEDLESPLFLSRVNRGSRAPLTRDGVRLLLDRLKRQAKIRESCSPHAFRRTCAVWSLRNGSHAFAIQASLGHTDLEMTKRYCQIAQADVEDQHRRYGPLTKYTIPQSQVH